MRADAARVPGGFVDADDSHLISAQDGCSAQRHQTRAERAVAEHARSAPLHRRGAPPLEIGPVGGPSGS